MSQPIISFANLFEVHQRQRKRIANRENHGNASGWSQSERAWFNYQAPCPTFQFASHRLKSRRLSAVWARWRSRDAVIQLFTINSGVLCWTALSPPAAGELFDRSISSRFTILTTDRMY